MEVSHKPAYPASKGHLAFLRLPLCVSVIVLAGCSDNGTGPDSEPNQRPIADAGLDQHLTVRDVVRLDGFQCSDPDGDALTYNWSFVSRPPGSTAALSSPSEPDPTFTPDVAGDFIVELTVSDGRAVSDPDSVTIQVDPRTPEPGDWWGVAEFGGLGFTVNEQGTAITNFSFTFLDWQCGGVTRDTTIASSSPSGWPITNGEVMIEVSFPTIDLTMAVHGTFAADNHASGTWTGVSSGTTCSGGWGASVEAIFPRITVFKSANFTQTIDIVGFHWLPGSRVTIEIDYGANGTINFGHTGTVDNTGIARFHEGSPPFAVTEGDRINMYDAVRLITYDVLYVTLESVDAAADLVSGTAREGTDLWVGVYDLAQPFPELLYQVDLTVGATETWVADFAGVCDILPNTEGFLVAYGGGGNTTIVW